MNTAYRRSPLKIAVVLAILLVASLAGDRALGLLGFAADWAPPVDHGPNHDEVRTNPEFKYVFRTNSQGLRYRELPLEKTAPSEYRTLVLGDSYVEGFGIDERATFASRLETVFSTPSRQAEFINCGLTGTGPLQYGRVFLDVGLRYHPDAVLLVVHANDVSDTDSRSYDMVKRGIWYIPPDAERSPARRAAHALWPHAYLMGRGVLDQYHRRHPGSAIAGLEDLAKTKGVSQSRIDAWQKSLPPELAKLVGTDQFSWWILGLGLVNPAYWTDSLDIDTESARARWTAMSGVLTETVKQARARNLAVAVVFAPVAFQYDPEYGDLWTHVGVHVRREWLTEQSELERSLQRWANEDDVPFLNLTTPFREAVRDGRRGLNFRMDPHWTEAGHAVAADAIAAWLPAVNRHLD